MHAHCLRRTDRYCIKMLLCIYIDYTRNVPYYDEFSSIAVVPFATTLAPLSSAFHRTDCTYDTACWCFSCHRLTCSSNRNRCYFGMFAHIFLVFVLLPTNTVLYCIDLSHVNGKPAIVHS